MLFPLFVLSLAIVGNADPIPALITPAPEVAEHKAPSPSTTITTCTSSSIQYPDVGPGYDLHHVCGTQCSDEYPICNCVQYALYSWYCGADPYDTESSTYYGCCQDWGNGTYGCFCDGDPGAP